METFTLALMGAAAGVMAGLLGIGGGALIVPVLVLVFEAQRVNPEIIMHSALGTSMATIVFTALSSFMAHHRRGAVLWPVFRQITPGILVGGLLGSAIVEQLSSHVLHIMFVVFMFGIAVYMGRGSVTADPHRRSLPGTVGMSLAGTVIGTFSALFGIGGGALSVPFMTWCSIPPRNAVATSAAIGFPIAIGATTGYVIAGWDAVGLPEWSVGYVALPAFAGIVVASMAAAPFGARLAHQLSDKTLRRIYAVFVGVLGLHMLWKLM